MKITQTNVYDAIVIGARCAGSPTAMLLARQGYRVLLLEKAIFPSEVPRGHVIQGSGVALLKEWGLFEQVLASDSPPISRLVFDLGPLTLRGMPQDATIIAPRHGVLDKILADAAVASGVEMREGFLVQEILMDGERVIGIRGRNHNGVQVTERANIVIGADGLYSLVANAVGAPVYSTKPALTCAYFTYFSDLPVEETSIYVRDAKQTERFLGVTDIPNFFRKPYGPGWALVGDAGYHKDPYTAQGISDAFFSAKLLAEAIDAGFSEQQPLEEALAEYERQRNAELLPRYEFNYQLASFEPPSPEMQHLFAALSDNQAETNNFFGVISGTVPITEFFSPANLQRIISQNDMLLPASD